MTAMTKRERVMRTVRFEETDRVPLYDIFQNDAIIEHYARKRLTFKDGAKTTARAVGRALDMTRMITGPQRPREDVRPDGTQYRQERWTGWIIERGCRDLAALIPWVEDRIREANAQVFDNRNAESLHRYIEEQWALFGQSDPTVLVIESGVGLDGMYYGAGMELFTELLIERPDLVDEWMEALVQAELRRVAVVADPYHIPVALTYTDIAHKTGTLFSPGWLRAHWLPRLKRLNDAWHARGTVCIFHSDGNLWSVLDDLIAAGIDGLNPIEVLAGMTVKSVRDRFPNLVLAGGIDVSQLLTNGTPGEVREVCRQAIRDTQGRGFFMGSSTELHWEVRLENAIAMFEAAWESGAAACRSR